MKDEFLEKLAALEHEQWAHWMKYFFEKCFTIQMKLGVAIKIDQKDFDRWTKQMNTPYALLTEKEKDSDREWGKKVIEIVNAEYDNLNCDICGSHEIINLKDSNQSKTTCCVDFDKDGNCKKCGKKIQFHEYDENGLTIQSSTTEEKDDDSMTLPKIP